MGRPGRSVDRGTEVANRIYQFASSFQIDLSPAGARETTFFPGAKTFALLESYRVGQLVTKSDLLDALSQGAPVGEEGLISCVYELRSATIHRGPGSLRPFAAEPTLLSPQSPASMVMRAP